MRRGAWMHSDALGEGETTCVWGHMGCTTRGRTIDSKWREDGDGEQLWRIFIGRDQHWWNRRCLQNMALETAFDCFGGPRTHHQGKHKDIAIHQFVHRQICGSHRSQSTKELLYCIERTIIIITINIILRRKNKNKFGKERGSTGGVVRQRNWELIKGCLSKWFRRVRSCQEDAARHDHWQKHAEGSSPQEYHHTEI